MLTLVLALTSAVAYGVSDFVGGMASRRVQALRIVFISYPVSAIVIAAIAPFVGGAPTQSSMLWGLASGVVMALAMWWFYLALAEGPMSVVSPLTAIIVAGLPVVVGVAQGERPSVLSWAGIGLVVLAVLLVSREGKPVDASADRRRFTPRVAWLTVGAGICFALSFIFTHQIEAGTGLWPLLAARIVASLIVIVIAFAVKQRKPVSGMTLVLAVSVGLLDVVANVTMLLAFQGGLLSLVSVLISLYPAVTVGLAIAILKERVIKFQVFGMAIATAAIATIAIAG